MYPGKDLFNTCMFFCKGKWGDFLQQTHSERQKDLVKPKIQIPALEWNTVLKPFRCDYWSFLDDILILYTEQSDHYCKCILQILKTCSEKIILGQVLFDDCVFVGVFQSLDSASKYSYQLTQNFTFQ